MKKIITVGFLAISSGLGAYLILRKNKIERILDKLTFKIIDVRNFKIHSGNLKVDLYVRIENPTDETLSINTGILKLERLRVFEKSTKKQLAQTELQLNEIELAAKGFYDLPALNIAIPLLTGAMIALNQLTSGKGAFIKKMFFELDIKTLNYTKTFKIN